MTPVPNQHKSDFPILGAWGNEAGEGGRKLGCAKCPAAALGNFQCGQGLWANPSQGQTWGRDRDREGTWGKDPAPLAWACGGFPGGKWGIIGIKKGIKMTPG